MFTADLSRIALELSPEERLELARRLVESVVEPAPLNEALTEGIRRIEAIAAGRIEGLTGGTTSRRLAMTVIFHPEFPRDIRKFEADYAQIRSLFFMVWRATGLFSARSFPAVPIR